MFCKASSFHRHSLEAQEKLKDTGFYISWHLRCVAITSSEDTLGATQCYINNFII